MVIYRGIENVEPVTDTVLTIGSYDGLHRGHQEVVNRTVATARALGKESVVITFDPHPKQILDTSAKPFELLVHIEKKLRLLEAMGIDIALVVPFTLDFSRTSPRDFLEGIVIKYFRPSKIIIGYDHRFGHERQGNGLFLQDYGRRGSFDVEIISSVRDQDEALSSTRIRELIREGFVRRASFELGWVYGFEAVVVRGSGRGHLLEFPTANFVPKNSAQLIPKTGVYFARGVIGSTCLYGMCNIGYRPTFGEDEFVMEIHFFDGLEEELYGKTIEVQFLERIRDEARFDSAEQLVQQLKEDREYCASRMNIYKQEESCLQAKRRRRS